MGLCYLAKRLIDTPKKIRYRWAIGLSEAEQRQRLSELGKRHVDFIGPVETYWSISVVNRYTALALLKNGFALGLYNEATYRRFRLLDRTTRKKVKSGRLSSLLLPISDRRPHLLLDGYEYFTNKPRKRDIVFFGYIELIRKKDFGKFNIGWAVFETAPIPPLHRKLCQSLDLLLVPSQFVAQLCIDSGIDRSRIEIYPHCVDDAEFNPARASQSYPDDGVFRFLNIGLDHYKQGREILIEAYLSEFEFDEPVALIIKSSGVNRKKNPQLHETEPVAKIIEDIKAKLGKTNYPNITLIESHEISDLVSLYGRSDCYVSPLYSNGFALTVLESMACARPAIVTRYGGLLDYCDDVNSLLVDVDEMIAAKERQYYCDDNDITLGFFAKPSLTDLKSKMRFAFQNQSAVKEMGVRAHESVKSKYSLEENSKILKEILTRRLELGKQQIDFIGPVETNWSISVANRALIRSAIGSGFSIALDTSKTLKWFLSRDAKAKLKSGRLNRLLLPVASPRTDILLGSYDYFRSKKPKREIVLFGYIELVRKRFFGEFNLAWAVFETAPIPPLYRKLCNLLDVLLVPSEFVRRLCIESGIDKRRIELLPLCVDFSEFNPEVADKFHPGDNIFRFLNIGLDHHKQGRALLLEAFLTEFNHDEPVSLIIKTSRLTKKRQKGNPHESAHVSQILTDLKKQLGRAHYPEVEIIDSAEIHDLTALYGKSDCYVSPLYSNGFALTVLESMACARPVIITRYGGALDFCNDENSYLVEVDEMVAAKRRQYYSQETDVTLGFFAKPSLSDLKEKMRWAFQNREAVKERGRTAYQSVRARYSLEGNSELFREILVRRLKDKRLSVRQSYSTNENFAERVL